jgi:hypothetical protein
MRTSGCLPCQDFDDFDKITSYDTANIFFMCNMRVIAFGMYYANIMCLCFLIMI